MKNIFFGKICEDTRKFNDLRIIMDEDKIRKLTKKEGPIAFKICNDNLAAVLMDRNNVKLNRPRYRNVSYLC